jgi:S1-C subfamily serine protease
MANAFMELSAALRQAVKKGAEYTAGLEHEPYHVSAVLIGGDRALTASHLVSDDGTVLVLPDGRKEHAKVVGRDPIQDLALLQLDSKEKFPTPPIAEVGVGDLVVALRRDPFDGINASLSLVSSTGAKLRLGRSGMIERYIQTAADRMPGSTGGPLVNGEGALVGIQVFNRRMGYEVAIPAELALRRAQLIQEKGSIKKPYLGIKSQTVSLSGKARETLSSRQETGLLVLHVETGSAAERGGLEVGDILVGMAGSPVPDHELLMAAMSERGVGTSVDIQVSRGGELKTLTVTIGGS